MDTTLVTYLFDNFTRLLVTSQTHKLRMPQVVALGPFRELDLGDKLRLQPMAVFHFTRRKYPMVMA